jgi:hypothetical protein
MYAPKEYDGSTSSLEKLEELRRIDDYIFLESTS